MGSRSNLFARDSPRAGFLAAAGATDGAGFCASEGMGTANLGLDGPAEERRALRNSLCGAGERVGDGRFCIGMSFANGLLLRRAGGGRGAGGGEGTWDGGRAGTANLGGAFDGPFGFEGSLVARASAIIAASASRAKASSSSVPPALSSLLFSGPGETSRRIAGTDGGFVTAGGGCDTAGPGVLVDGVFVNLRLGCGGGTEADSSDIGLRAVTGARYAFRGAL